jgi:hypothetical protein
MKVKLSTIQAAEQGFLAILKASMPVKLSYAIGKNLKKIVSKMDDIEKSRLGLVSKYGTTNDKGLTQVTPENMDTFNKEYGDLLTQEVELDLWKISLNKLSDAGVRLTPEQVLSLEEFIEDDTVQTEQIPAK